MKVSGSCIAPFSRTFGTPRLSVDACVIPVFAVFEDQGQTSTPKRCRSILKELDAASETCEIRPGKHDLTPSSKMAILPNAKRFEVGKRVLSLETEFVASTGSCITVASFLAIESS